MVPCSMKVCDGQNLGEQLLFDQSGGLLPQYNKGLSEFSAYTSPFFFILVKNKYILQLQV